MNFKAVTFCLILQNMSNNVPLKNHDFLWWTLFKKIICFQLGWTWPCLTERILNTKIVLLLRPGKHYHMYFISVLKADQNILNKKISLKDELLWKPIRPSTQHISYTIGTSYLWQCCKGCFPTLSLTYPSLMGVCHEIFDLNFWAMIRIHSVSISPRYS